MDRADTGVAMMKQGGQVKAIAPLVGAWGAVIAISLVIALLVGQRNQAREAQVFERDAATAFADIQGEIQRHIAVVDTVADFADATRPGDIEEWRRFLNGRVTAGNYLAFTSTAGLVERVPADQLEAVVERERVSDPDFAVTEPFPLGPEQDRLVLIRTGDTTQGRQVRGLEITAAVAALGLDLPGAGERLLVQSIDSAPTAVADVLDLPATELENDGVVGTNLIFVKAVGPEGEEPFGWVVIPGDIGYLLDNLSSEIAPGLGMTISVAGDEPAVRLGQLSSGDFSAVDADLVASQVVELGGWEWQLEIWGSDRGIGLDPALIVVLGVILGGLTAALVGARRRHGRRLVEARVELSLQRTLAETDHLTGLANRQGLAALRTPGRLEALDGAEIGGAVFFVDPRRIQVRQRCPRARRR